MVHSFHINLYLHEFCEPILFFDPHGPYSQWFKRQIWPNMKENEKDQKISVREITIVISLSLSFVPSLSFFSLLSFYYHYSLPLWLQVIIFSVTPLPLNSFLSFSTTSSGLSVLFPSANTISSLSGESAFCQVCD